MEAANKFITSAVNNSTVVNCFLGGVMLTLGFRSSLQQKEIDELEAQKASLLEKNKAVKKLMWDWKQRLYAEASDDSFPVALQRIKAIYGESQLSQVTGDAAKEDAKPPAPKLYI